MSNTVRGLLFATAIANCAACGAVDQGAQNSASGQESQLATAQERLSPHNSIPGSSLDWVHCATEWSADGYPTTCNVGQGGKYMAFGVPGTTSFYYKYFPQGPVSCGTGSFGDPASGSTKSCYFANFSQLATQGSSFTPYSSFGTTGNVIVAYGGNGVFSFKTVSAFSTFTCSRYGLGFSSEPNPSGPNDCYQALVGYHLAASEGQSFTTSSNHTSPVAFGSNGTFYYANLKGTVACNASNFGAPSGSGRTCFALDLGNYYLADEGGTFNMPSGYDVYPAQYTSGQDGNVIQESSVGAGTISCSNSTFQGLDPDYWVGKSCYGIALIH